jgi:hypothetical protein
MAISSYSTTPGSNTTISGINVAEGTAPGNINDAIRQMMADIKTWYDAMDLGSDVQAYDADLAALAANSTNGLWARTGAGTGSARTITAGANISVTNGNGVSGNPTVAVTGIGTTIQAYGLTLTNLEALTLAAGDLLYATGADTPAKLAIGANGTILQSDGSAPTWASRLNRGTTTATTSGTAIDFTGIPSWAKRVVVAFNGVSTDGTSHVTVQIGTSSGFISTGYVTSTAIGAVTTGFPVYGTSASDVRSGLLTIVAMGGDEYVAAGVVKASAGNVGSSGGNVTMTGTWDRVRITTSAGNFDAGSVNIFWE